MNAPNKMRPAISLDLETWGRSAGCAIRSIGATVFDPETGMLLDDHFYLNITDESCRELGLHFDQDTVEFWERQSDDAKAMFAHDQVDIRDALSRFAKWYHDMRHKHMIVTLEEDADLDVWGNDSVFDVGILGYAYMAVARSAKPFVWQSPSITTPWPFWCARDMRTVVALGRRLGVDVKRELSFNGVPHYALDDAKHQAKVIGITQGRIIAMATNPITTIPSEVKHG